MLAPLLVATLLAPGGIDDLKVGARCSLQQDVSFEIRGTSVITTLDRGTVVTVTHLGDQICRVASDGEEGLVPTAELIEACAPENKRCFVTSAFRARSAEINDGKRKVFRVKPGAEVMVLSEEEGVTTFEVSGVDAQVRSDVLEASCGAAPAKRGAGSTNDPLLEAVRPVPKGITTVVLPMATNGNISEANLTYFESSVHRAIARSFPRVSTPGAEAISQDERNRAMKPLFKQARVFASVLTVDFVIVTHIAETSPGHFLLSAAIYDKSGRRRAAVRARPTSPAS
jgi:hypothetical protein